MTSMNRLSTFAMIIAAGMTASAMAQLSDTDPSLFGGMDAGPDVIVGDCMDTTRWATIGNKTAYSVGTVSCNIGNERLKWIAGTNEHPVIGQNMYRYKNGRFEQIGQSWLKHGYTALQQSLCQTCAPNPNGTMLGVGCSDPYWATLNGSHTTNRLGPKYQVNAATGYFPFPPAQPQIQNDLSRRLQVLNDDVNPALNAGARYAVEGQYVTADDTAAGNKNNNASWRETYVVNSSFDLSFTGGNPPTTKQTQRTQPGILAWKNFDPGVEVLTFDVPNDGRYYVAYRVTRQGNDYRYEYCIQNLTSDRSGAAFELPVPPTATTNNAYFRDVEYHSGEVISNTDWSFAKDASGARWSCTETYAQNQYANALRWGTMYTFAFVSNMGPNPHAHASLRLFKPGTPEAIVLTGVPAPGCWTDCDLSTGAGVLDIFDFLCFQNEFAAQAPYACNADTSTGMSVCDVFDFLAFQNAFGAGCQ